MPAPPPAFYPENVLEDAILTLSPDGAAADKPIERIVDRDIGLECEDSGVSGTRTWLFDRGVGASTPTVDAWIFAGSHYDGELLTLASSPDGSSWTSRGTVTPADDEPQRVELTPFAVPRYVRVTVTDPDLPVIFTEMFLSPEIAFTWKPAAGSITEPQILNVNVVESASGRAFGVQRGARRWSQRFVITASPDVDRVQMLSILDALADTAKAFWFLAVTEELRWVRMLGPIAPQGVSNSPTGDWDMPVSLIEELP